VAANGSLELVLDCVARAESGQPFTNVVDLSRGY